jgi:hypothetical protein
MVKKSISIRAHPLLAMVTLLIFRDFDHRLVHANRGDLSRNGLLIVATGQKPNAPLGATKYISIRKWARSPFARA